MRIDTGHYLLPTHSTVEFDATHILFGGDQLTVARMRGTHATEETAVKRLQGNLPVVEDWHTRMTFLKVKIYDYRPILLHFKLVTCRQFGADCSKQRRLQREAPCFS